VCPARVRLDVKVLLQAGRDEQTLIDACYRRQVRDLSACSRITRDPNNFEISDVLAITENIGSVNQVGIDFNFTYKAPEFDFGKLSAAWDTSYVIDATSDNLGFDETSWSG
jgi:hypothetical protein